jgi:hypothetical protein
MNKKHLEGRADYDAMKTDQPATRPGKEKGFDQNTVIDHGVAELVHVGLKKVLSPPSTNTQLTRSDARVGGLQPDQTTRPKAGKGADQKVPPKAQTLTGKGDSEAKISSSQPSNTASGNRQRNFVLPGIQDLSKEQEDARALPIDPASFIRD